MVEKRRRRRAIGRTGDVRVSVGSREHWAYTAYGTGEDGVLTISGRTADRGPSQFGLRASDTPISIQITDMPNLVKAAFEALTPAERAYLHRELHDMIYDKDE